jgi:transposase
VIGLSGTVRVLVTSARALRDWPRWREQMQADPFSGAVYVFRAKRADRVKLIYWDGTGVCLFAKRLEDGKFRWPSVRDGVMRLSPAELSALEGLDWKRIHAAREILAPVQPG